MKLLLLCASLFSGGLSSLKGEVVVVVAVHRIWRRISDPEAVGGGGVETQVGSLYKWGGAKA
jgi:hypothetical protein